MAGPPGQVTAAQVLVLAEALRVEQKDGKGKGSPGGKDKKLNQPRLPRKTLMEIARKKDPDLRG